MTNDKPKDMKETLFLAGTIRVGGPNIADRLKMEYRTKAIELKDRAAAVEWIIRNQFGRRNLSAYQRGELALILKPIIAARAKEKQREAGGAVRQKSDKAAVDTKKELASVAGVSHDTIHKAKVIAARADDERAAAAIAPAS